MNIVVDARKDKYDADTAWDLLKDAKTIITAKGKKVQTWNPVTDDKATILRHVMASSGNLRAPAFRYQDTFIVGFNPELYADWVQKQ